MFVPSWMLLFGTETGSEGMPGVELVIMVIVIVSAL